jgi:outer membrane protein TolC
MINSENQTNDYIKSLDAKANALIHTASSLDSAYRPQVSLEESFSVYEYAHEDTNPMVENLNRQNTIMLSINMQLFDNGAIKKQKQALLIQHRAMQEQIDQAKLEKEKSVKSHLSNHGYKKYLQLEESTESIEQFDDKKIYNLMEIRK